MQIRFKDGSTTDKLTVEYPVGHRRRRAEGIPLLEQKFETNLARVFSKERQAAILELCKDQRRLEQTPVNEFVDLMVLPKKRDGSEISGGCFCGAARFRVACCPALRQPLPLLDVPALFGRAIRIVGDD